MGRLFPELAATLRARSLFSASLLSACSLTNQVDVCGVTGEEFRVNVLGDKDEWLASPQAVAELSSGRLLVTWSVQPPASGTDLPASSSVSYALIDAATGARVIPCNRSVAEASATDPELVYAVGPSAARADLELFSVTPVEGVLGWVEWIGGSSAAKRVRLQFVGADGCTSGLPFEVVSDVATPNTQGLSLAWSRAGRFVLAAFHDGERVYASRVVNSQFGHTLEIANEHVVLGAVASAVSRDGTALLAWLAYENGGALSRRELTLRVAVLDAEFRVAAGPHRLELPFRTLPAGSSPSVTATVHHEGFAVTVDAAADVEARLSTLVLELGRDGRALGPPLELGTGEGANARSSWLATPGGSLATWRSSGASGTVARLFSEAREPRFNAVTCDENWLSVGSRAGSTGGFPQARLSADKLWIFHVADPPSDPFGAAVMAWRVPFGALWPAEP